ncbi:MAG: ABC transporter substrate-binding protein [Desulfuromonadales bacterium]|nr:ABC transporter substrate-binding protein [Desulfuromonadales bacterium]
MRHPLSIALLLVTLLMLTPRFAASAPPLLRVGHFANITHAQALVGRETGAFSKATGAEIEWKAFNAGPSEMEALIAGAIDIAYVGPNPALNAYLRSGGKALRIVAGAASGGAALVVRKGAGIAATRDLKGKRVASPEYGNTQDVALRCWLKSQGFAPNRDVRVLTVKNPDILMLFLKGELDAAWVPEPWATRLVREGNGTIFLDERNIWPGGKFTTAVLVVRSEYLQTNRAMVKHFIKAHLDVTEWISKHPVEARNSLNRELAKLVGKPMPGEVLAEAMSRVTITYDPLKSSLDTSAKHAWSLGFLPGKGKAFPDITTAVDLSVINEVLKERHKPRIE